MFYLFQTQTRLVNTSLWGIGWLFYILVDRQTAGYMSKEMTRIWCGARVPYILLKIKFLGQIEGHVYSLQARFYIYFRNQ